MISNTFDSGFPIYEEHNVMQPDIETDRTKTLYPKQTMSVP